MINIFEHEQIGPFYATIQDALHPNDGSDCICLHLAIDCYDAVPREYFPVGTPLAAVWRRAVELTQARLAEWGREVAEFNRTHQPGESL